mmetsp:Transcript_90029/g.280206  ORF Transcript_90029/g.280206 Transcript_90029/m.280206 type:complete len:340 (-) Transcript_90029:57-1076(-)
MAAPARALALALLQLALPAADALRTGPSCLGLDAGSFPLSVDELLEAANHSKTRYFEQLRHMGITSRMKMTGPGLPNVCLTRPGRPRLHVIFVGDSMTGMASIAYTRNAGDHAATRQQKRRGEAFEEAVRRARSDFEGSVVVPGAPASVVWWAAREYIRPMLESVQAVISDQGLDLSRDTVVMWMSAFVHGLFRGDDRWVKLDGRAGKIEGLLRQMNSTFPGAHFVWESSFPIDVALMGADPPKDDTAMFKPLANPTHVKALTDIDVAVTSRFGVPMTQRGWVMTKYRGLLCDGLHADPHRETAAESWGCYGFRAVEDLVFQSGLYAACKGQRAPFCLT